MSAMPTTNAARPPMPPGPITGPSAWRGADMRKSDAWIHHLTAGERAELDAALVAG